MSNQNSNLAQYYANFEITMEVIHVCNKGRYLHPLKEYEIYKHIQESSNNNVLNDQLKL